MVRRIGPLTPAAIVERTQPTTREQVPAWLTSLERDRRLLRVRLGGVPAEEAEQWCAVEDAGRLRDALGVALPVGVPEAFTEPVADPLGDLVTRHARSHGPFTAAALARRFGVGSAVVAEVLQRLESRGRLVSGRLRPES